METKTRETTGLIGSDKVEGTIVYGAKGEKIGSIERVMIEKRSSQVAYAVLSFGGFLGDSTSDGKLSRLPLMTLGFSLGQ